MGLWLGPPEVAGCSGIGGTSERGMLQEGLKETGQAEGLPLKMEQRQWALGREDGGQRKKGARQGISAVSRFTRHPPTNLRGKTSPTGYAGKALLSS